MALQSIIHAYDEDVKWQLAEPGDIDERKNYRDKKGTLTCGEIERVSLKNLTIKCVQLTEQGKLTAKVDGQQEAD